jgi:hypothetical protein
MRAVLSLGRLGVIVALAVPTPDATSGAEPSTTPRFLKKTRPVGTVPFEDLTVAVKTIGPLPLTGQDEVSVIVVVPGGGTWQRGRVMVFVSRVTAAVRARRRPFTVTPVVAVIEACARMVPAKLEPVPSVAELPTCQKTLHAWAPPVRVTVLPEAVMRVDAALKMKIAFGFPCASRVRFPVIPKVPAVEL